MRLGSLLRPFAAVAVITPCLLGAQAVLGQAASAAPVPTVTGVAPDAGPAGGGSVVTITGTSFTGVTGVTIGGAPAQNVIDVSDTTISALTPPHAAGVADVAVTTPDGTATLTSGYTYETDPVVASVSPASGPDSGGSVVTITGSGFFGTTAVHFGSSLGQNVVVASDSELTVLAPGQSAGTVDITVTNSLGTNAMSPADQYTYLSPPPVCTTTVTGTHSTQLTVSSGLTCLVNARQSGAVTVSPGASLSVTSSTVNGTVTATAPASVTYCGSAEAGTLSVSGATGPVILGGTLPDGASCAPDKIPSLIGVTGSTGPVTVTGLTENGTLTLSGNTGGVTLSGSSVNGLVYVQNNGGPAVTVAGNTVTGSLACAGNNPAPADAGAVNTVSGTASGQCAAIAKR